MENSAYVPSTGHLNSPALVVFSQAAGGLQDALRIQRPFNPQFAMSEASKDLHRPFTASSFGLRHMEAYSGLPAHILNHLHPQFLHPGLSLGSGAFRPLTDLKSFPSPSAFAPPKCLKIETNSDNVHHSGGGHGPTTGAGIFSPSEDRFLGPSPRTTDSCSPASASMSPQPQTTVKEESLDAHMSEDGDVIHGPATDNDSPGIHDDNRGFRIGPLFGGRFSASSSGGYTFSVPGLPPAAHALTKTSFLFDHAGADLRLGVHTGTGLVGQLTRLAGANPMNDVQLTDGSVQIVVFSYSPDSDAERFMPADIGTNNNKNCPVCGLAISPGDLEAHLMHELEILYKINGTGLAAAKKGRIEAARHTALPGDSGPEGRWETFQRIKTNRQGRLRMKLRKRKAEDCLICIGRLHRTPEEMNLHSEQCRKNAMNDEDETVDVEGDSELEEWAEGQRRRTNSLTTARILTDVDNESDDVIVDGDEPEDGTFGPSQYTESDVVIKNVNDKNKEKEGQSQVATVNSSGDVEVKVESAGQQCDSNVSTSDAEPSSRAQMIEDLRNRIRQLEAEGGTDTATSTEIEEYKCLICLEHYKKPVISTVCWHVYCEECWLHALAGKKICPQCSMITSPTDLRRIFM